MTYLKCDEDIAVAEATVIRGKSRWRENLAAADASDVALQVEPSRCELLRIGLMWRTQGPPVTKGTRVFSSPTVRPSATESFTADEEHELAEWLLTQRLLHEAGLLEKSKVDDLTRAHSDWDSPSTDTERAYAILSGSAELTAAVQRWYQVLGASQRPNTSNQPRVLGVISLGS